MNIDKDRPYMLAYGFFADRLEKLEEAASAGGIGIKLIGRDNLDTIVRELLLRENEELPANSGPHTSPELDPGFILFVNIGQEALYQFLEVMKEKDLFVPYKAGLTANNITWPLRELIAANRQEHEYIKLYQDSKKALYFGMDLYEKTKDNLLFERLEQLLEYITSIENGQETLEQETSKQDEAARFTELRKRYNALAMKINEIVRSKGNAPDS